MKRCAPRAPNTPLPSPGTPIACSSVPCTYVAPASRAMTRRPLVESSGQWDLGVCPVTAHSCAAQTDVPLCPFDSKRTALERPPNRSAPAPDGFAGKLALPIQAQLGRRGHGGLWGAGLKELLALPSLDRRRRCARRGRGAAAIAARGRRGTEAQVGLALWAGVRYGARRTRRVQRRVRATMMPSAMACPAAHQRAVPRCRWIDAPLGLSTARSARSGPRLCCASPQPRPAVTYVCVLAPGADARTRRRRLTPPEPLSPPPSAGNALIWCPRGGGAPPGEGYVQPHQQEEGQAVHPHGPRHGRKR